MRKTMRLIGATAMAFATVAAPHWAAAATDRYPHTVPQDCGYLAAKLGPSKVWQAQFWAQRVDDFGHIERLFVAPCFASQANCVAWLYWAQSDWPDHLAPGRCKTGMPY